MADLLGIGKSGLAVSKKGLETTSHNISNANSEGYSRQKVHQQSSFPVLKSGLIMGTGARIKSIARVEEENIEKKLTAGISDKNKYQERSLQLDQVEHIFNEIDNEGLNQIFNRFFNSFRELGNAPENETIRSVVRDNARLVVNDIKRIRGTLDGISTSIDKKIASSVEDVNQILNQIAFLNKKIASIEAMGDQTGDLRDQRDISLRSLSEFFAIQTYVDNKNHFVVSAQGIGTLVSAAEVSELAVKPVHQSEAANNMPGSVEIVFKSRPNSVISEKFNGGKLNALVTAKNQDIFQLQNDIDELAHTLVQSVNSIHTKGVASGKVTYDPETGEYKTSDGKKASNINFFTPIDTTANAANLISISDEIESDLANISSALEPNSPGDNRVALAISKLAHAKIMNDGDSTMEESYLKSVGRIGIQAGKAKLDLDQNEALLAQTTSLKERITGVSLDEEAANLIRYQHAYEASAKVLKTAEELFRTVLDIKR